MYLLVITCMNIRSIHLELVPSMSSAHFVQAFVRFVNRNNIPKAIYSDNAQTFIESMKIIGKGSCDNEFETYLEKNDIKHRKIPIRAAWIGSAWERVIRTIKNSLHKMIGRKHMEYFNLITLISDVEQAINSRPLCYVDNEDTEFSVLTPNHFLKMNAGKCVRVENISGSELKFAGKKELVKALNSRQDLYDEFHALWVEEYLVSLREASRELYQGTWENKIEKGDSVLISDPLKSRNFW